LDIRNIAYIFTLLEYALAIKIILDLNSEGKINVFVQIQKQQSFIQLKKIFVIQGGILPYLRHGQEQVLN